jgi:hypothetical protein
LGSLHTNAHTEFYANFLSREWTHVGGFQFGLQYKRAFSTQSRWSVGLGLEYMRFMTGLSAYVLGYNNVRSADVNYTNSPGVFIGSDVAPPPPSQQSQWFHDHSQEHFIYDSNGQILASPGGKPVLTTRQHIVIPIQLSYQTNRIRIEGGAGAMLPFMSSTYMNSLPASTSSFFEVTPAQRFRSEFSIRGQLALGYRINKKWLAQAGFQQGFTRLSVNKLPIYAPQKSITLGLVYTIK